MIPQAAQLLGLPGRDKDHTEALLPELAIALAGDMPMLADYQHCFDNTLPYVPGTCTRSGCREVIWRRDRNGFERCTSCDAVYCCVCAAEAEEKITHANDVVRLLHDARGEHTWTHAASTRWAICTICGSSDAMVCACGAQRCEACLAFEARATRPRRAKFRMATGPIQPAALLRRVTKEGSVR